MTGGEKEILAYDKKTICLRVKKFVNEGQNHIKITTNKIGSINK